MKGLTGWVVVRGAGQSARASPLTLPSPQRNHTPGRDVGAENFAVVQYRFVIRSIRFHRVSDWLFD
jgi:hypothetical protein